MHFSIQKAYPGSALQKSEFCDVASVYVIVQIPVASAMTQLW